MASSIISRSLSKTNNSHYPPSCSSRITNKLSNISFHLHSRKPSKLTLRVLNSTMLDEGGDFSNTDKSLEFNGDFNAFSFDSQTLPRPLTSSNLSYVGSGSRLKVAYQGLPGAYSEAAAEKAYPNCVAVPCEHFETAFEVSFFFFCAMHMSSEYDAAIIAQMSSKAE